MKSQSRLTANYVRKYFPSLRRISTEQGRKWTINGQETFDSLRDLVRHYESADKGYAKEREDVPAE